LNTPDSKPTGAAPAVDFDQLQSACDGDPAMMRELMDMYFQQADDIMVRLEQAIKGNVVGEVNHLAHKLAGSSLACGMSAVVPSLRQLEGNAKAGHLIAAAELLADVTTQMKVIRGLVQNYLVQFNSPKKPE
jgi:HPt (histidine-containing phosphotransfer) domain-containing protein